jgi:hypothetical protein
MKLEGVTKVGLAEGTAVVQYSILVDRTQPRMHCIVVAQAPGNSNIARGTITTECVIQWLGYCTERKKKDEQVHFCLG